jgi:CRP/FNR family cyclic AMP-dependent transcriptional regulator
VADNLPPHVLDQLRGLSLFDEMADDELAEIETLVDDIDVDPGQVLIREGWLGQQAFVILTGQAAVSVQGQRIATVGPGEIVGQTALTGGDPRPATVTAVTPMHLVVLDQARFGISSPHDSIVVKMLAVISKRPEPAEADPRPRADTPRGPANAAGVPHGIAPPRGRRLFRCRFCLERFHVAVGGYCLYSPDARHDLEEWRH